MVSGSEAGEIGGVCVFWELVGDEEAAVGGNLAGIEGEREALTLCGAEGQ